MKSIVILDDSPDVTMLLSAGLRFDGHAVWTAGTGADARALIERESPVLLLLDVQMPGQDGPAFLTELLASKPDLLRTMKVVYLSAGEAPEDPRASGAISKMAGLDEIARAVQLYLRDHEAESSTLA